MAWTISCAEVPVLPWPAVRREKRVCGSAFAWFSLRLNCRTLLCKYIEKWQIVTRWPFLQSNIAINHLSLDGELGSERVKGQHKVLYLGPLCAAACMFSLGQQNNLARTTKHIREWNLWCSAIKFKTICPLFHFLYFLSLPFHISAKTPNEENSVKMRGVGECQCSCTQHICGDSSLRPASLNETSITGPAGRLLARGCWVAPLLEHKVVSKSTSWYQQVISYRNLRTDANMGGGSNYKQRNLAGRQSWEPFKV